MKTYREIVYSVIEFVSGFHVTDDNPFDESMVAKKIDDVRAVLVKQQYIQEGHVEDLFYQECEVTIEEQLRTKENPFGQAVELVQFYIEFPELMPNIGWQNIKYLGKKDYSNNYNRRSMDGIHASPGRFWARKEVDFTVIGTSKALVKGEKEAKDIITLALFKSPMDVPGMTWDMGYPVPDPHKLEMIVKQDIAAGLGIPPDDKNDARHNQNEMHGKP